MVRKLEPWDRSCPKCDTAFSSVQEYGVCPECLYKFAVARDGTRLLKGSFPEDRVEPRLLALPPNIEELVGSLPEGIVRRVEREFYEEDRPEVVEFLACYGIESCETGQTQILNAILDRSKGFKHAVRELVITAKHDWRDVLW